MHYPQPGMLHRRSRQANQGAKVTGSDDDPTPDRRPPVLTLLETRFPFKQLSRIAQADRRAVDPTYAAHRWWARRPPSVMRGLLLAAFLPSTTSEDAYWRLFAEPRQHLLNKRVHDLFVGGGTTLVEAARLGAIPSGTDVDPLAVMISRHELDPPEPRQVADAGRALLDFLEARTISFFRRETARWLPLHYFSLYRIRCPKCESETLLHRNLIIARGSAKTGAVVRDCDIVAFCPECLKVHKLDDPDRKLLYCCSRRHLESGNYQAQRFTCEDCGHTATHRDLETGLAPRQLIAVEETAPDEHRRIRAAMPHDRKLAVAGSEYFRRHLSELDLPTSQFTSSRRDPRPISLGLKHPTQLFTERQLAVFGHGFKWVRTSAYPPQVKAALTLGLSNALATNNRLCGYATEYGRLAPLFSVRGYSLALLAVELNPFHPSGGRGTLIKSLQKVVRSSNGDVRRYVWSLSRRRPVATFMTFTRQTASADVRCVSASDVKLGDTVKDLLIFDPPYFDYIAYSELSEFYRTWLETADLGGTSLLPDAADPVGSFSSGLVRCLRPALKSLAPNRPLVFTFHSASTGAWRAIGAALDAAELSVTALWPVRNDGHMGHHASPGNCEWDVVVVCRRRSECRPNKIESSVSKWSRSVAPLKISKVDRLSMRLAIVMASERAGRAISSNEVPYAH